MASYTQIQPSARFFNDKKFNEADLELTNQANILKAYIDKEGFAQAIASIETQNKSSEQPNSSIHPLAKDLLDATLYTTKLTHQTSSIGLSDNGLAMTSPKTRINRLNFCPFNNNAFMIQSRP